MATGEVGIESARGLAVWRVEVAETPRQRAAGLSGRAGVPAGSGMFFLFDEEQPGDAGFWMHGVRMPLSIAYIDTDWTIVTIREMEPCMRPLGIGCPRHAPGVPYRAALEVAGGEMERAGVGPGDRVRFQRNGGPGR
ncbi:MAG TPA: DUF192 domain-containing protein [Longimicrobiaceae bacterium]|nr:DUF192 domain-containing protein [Longimicrobiaceae bacterium]